VDDGFEQIELTEPRKALDAAMAESQVVSPQRERVRGWNFTEWVRRCMERQTGLAQNQVGRKPCGGSTPPRRTRTSTQH
jgi:putative intracellular protease/amidase